MKHKVNALASDSQNYVQKIESRRELDFQSTLSTEEECLCPKCRLPYGSDCNGICFEPYWVKQNEVF